MATDYRQSRNARQSKNINSKVPENGKKKLSSKQKRKKKFKTLLIVEIVVFVIFLIFAAIFLYVKSKFDVMNQNAEDFNQADVQTSDVKTSERYRMIMLYGVDARNNKDVASQANADSDIICRIDNETGEIILISVLRDTFMQTSNGKYKKLTDVYSNYGVKESLQTINRNLDLGITEYISVNWKGLIDAVDILGGIDIKVTSSEITQLNKFGSEAAKVAGYKYTPLSGGEGVRHLNGSQAAGYARIRNVTVNGEGHDIARATRQRTVITEMLNVAKKAGFSTLKQILDKVLPEIATNISFADALALATDIGKYKIVDTGCYPYDYKDQSSLSTAYVYPTTLESNNIKLHEVLFGKDGYKPSSTVNKINDYIDKYRKEHP